MKKQQGFSAVEVSVAVVAIGLIGFLGFNAYRNANSDPIKQSISNSGELAAFESELSGVLSFEDISAKALEVAPSTELLGIELEADDSGLVYVVHLSDGQVLVFDAVSGERLELDDNENDELGDDDAIPANFVASISLSQAIEIAKEQRPNSTLKKVEIELEDGVVVYSVRFTDDSRVDVRAGDGEIQRLRDETGEDIIKLDDDFDDDGEDNNEDRDDDNDGQEDDEDSDDDNDGRDDDEDDDDDNDGREDDEDDEDRDRDDRDDDDERDDD